MANIIVNGGEKDTSTLMNILSADSIQPGSDPSYELCKLLYTYHPLGQKMTEAPIKMAQSKPRKISVGGPMEKMLVEAFENEWKQLQATKMIRNTMTLSRVYGIASIVVGSKKIDTDKPIPPAEIGDIDLYFNVADPLNTSGSLVLNQDPNASDFQKTDHISISGVKYHPSRSCVILNEQPIYIQFTSSAFGFVGRSVYQRVLFPLKSFIQTMFMDHMVATKAGLLVAKMKSPGSVVDNSMLKMFGKKREELKLGANNNVLSIGIEETIESVNLLNLEGPAKLARDNILKNIATGSDMPAALLDQETFARGMAEGDNDAKNIAQYINGIREDMQPLYDFFDNICMRRAWNRAFYEAAKNEFAGLDNISYENALYGWMTDFSATWQSFLDEGMEERGQAMMAKFTQMRETAALLLPMLDPENKAEMVRWLADNMNADEETFSIQLTFDYEALQSYEPSSIDSAPDADDEPD